MFKILEATCEEGVVSSEGVEVPGAQILGEGVGASSGALLLQGSERTYIPKTSPDLKQTLEKVAAALNTIAETLTSIGAGMTGATTAPPGDLVTKVTEIQGVATDLETLMEALK
jgi:hypothetical protein